MKRATRQVEAVVPPKGRQGGNAWVRVYEFLKDRIINGTYGPGEKLNERDIATLANVSRTPTREALRALEHEGFVSTIAKRGVFVKKYSLDELDVLHRMLIRLEGLAVGMAVPRLTKKDLTELQRMTNRMKSLALRRKYGEYLTLNFEFHLFFARKSESKELLDAISQLRKRIFRFYHSHVTLAHDPKQYVEDHQEIIDALTGKIEKKPERLIEAHIDRARTSFMAFYKDFGP